MAHRDARGGLRKEEQVRALLAEKLRGPVHENIWQYLLDYGFVKEYLDGIEGADLEYLAKEYRKISRYLSPFAPLQRSRTRHASPDKRLQALSRIVACEMNRSRLVKRFRQDVLGGRLLAEEEIPIWIKQQDPGQQLWWWRTVRIPISAEGIVLYKGWIFPVVPPYTRTLTEIIDNVRILGRDEIISERVSREYLIYPCRPSAGGKNGDEGHYDVVSFGPGTTLAYLKEIARSFAGLSPSYNDFYAPLSGEYPFLTEPEAVRVILSGRPPLLWPAEINVGGCVGHPRLHLDVDARMSPAEVAKWYRHSRHWVFRGQDKPLTEKHLQLAVYLAEHFDTRWTSWARLMQLWNEDCPQWAYVSWRNFARDAKAAWCRVTGRGWIPRRGGTGGRTRPRRKADAPARRRR